MKQLSIIIPVFNEEKTVAAALKKVINAPLLHVRKEIILVNDGSTDQTHQIIQNIIAKHKNIHYEVHGKNKGKGAAVITGIQKARGDYVVIQDADLEYDPKYLTTLIKPVLAKKADIVYGTRLNRLPHLRGEERRFRFLLHYTGNRILSLLTSMLYGKWVTDMETCYKLFPKKALDGKTIHARGFEFEPEVTALLLKSKLKVVEVPITTNPRGYEEGKKLNTFRDGIKAVLTLFKYRFAS